MRTDIKTPQACRPIAYFGAFVGLASATVLLAPDVAHALNCGDPVQDDTTLTARDHVRDCPADQPVLTVEVDDVTLDLAGFTISCELSGSALTGTGIEVTAARTTVRHGRIKNCLTGVLVEGEGSLLERLTVTSSPAPSTNGAIGFHGMSDSNILLSNTVTNYPGEGYRLEGNSNVLQRDKAIKTGDHGFEVRGESNLFLWDRATGNVGDGFRSRGGGHNQFVHNIAIRNGDAGIQIRNESDNNLVIENTTTRNGFGGDTPCAGEGDDEDMDGGIAIKEGSQNMIAFNKSRRNCIGVKVEEGAIDNTIIENISQKNETDMRDGNVDCVNTWFDNKFKSSEPPDDPCIQ